MTAKAGGRLATAGVGAPTVVAYEADQIDEERRSGWSVVVTGLAVRVDGDEPAERCHGLRCPWVGAADHIIVVTLSS